MLEVNTLEQQSKENFQTTNSSNKVKVNSSPDSRVSCEYGNATTYSMSSVYPTSQHQQQQQQVDQRVMNLRSFRNSPRNVQQQQQSKKPSAQLCYINPNDNSKIVKKLFTNALNADNLTNEYAGDEVLEGNKRNAITGKTNRLNSKEKQLEMAIVDHHHHNHNHHNNHHHLNHHELAALVNINNNKNNKENDNNSSENLEIFNITQNTNDDVDEDEHDYDDDDINIMYLKVKDDNEHNRLTEDVKMDKDGDEVLLDSELDEEEDEDDEAKFCEIEDEGAGYEYAGAEDDDEDDEVKQSAYDMMQNEDDEDDEMDEFEEEEEDDDEEADETYQVRTGPKTRLINAPPKLIKQFAQLTEVEKKRSKHDVSSLSGANIIGSLSYLFYFSFSQISRLDR